MNADIFQNDQTWVVLGVLVAIAGGVLVFVSPLLAVVTLAGAVLMGALFARPIWGLPFLFLMVMISDAMPTGVQVVVNLTLSKVATLAVLGSWFLRCTINRTFPLRKNIMWAPMIACFVVLLVGLIRARDIGMVGVQFSVSFVLLIFMTQTLTALYDPERLRSTLLMVALVFVVISVLGIPFGLANEATIDFDRHKGFFQDPNEWCVALLLGIGPTVAILENTRNDLYRLVAIVGIAATAANIAMSVSRAGTLVFAIILPFLAVILWRRKWLLLASGLAAATVVLFFVDLEPLFMRFDSFVDAGEFETDGSMQTRSGLAKLAIATFLEHPFLGLGTMSFYQDVKVMSGGHYEKVVHNTYLQVLVEQGLLGAIPFVWFYAGLFWMLFRMWVNQRVQQFRRLTIGFATSLAGFGAMAFTLDLMTFTTAWFWVAMLLIADRLAQEPTERLAEIGLADEDDPALLEARAAAGQPTRGQQQAA